MPTLRKLNLACGTDIRRSSPDTIWTNLDIAPLEGVDLVHDLRFFPWPIADDTFDEIVAYDIIEHLPDTIRTMEELWRILKPGGVVEFRIPYWNSIHSINDPTHIKLFNENTLGFFDVDSHLLKTRPYYSTARFTTESLETTVALFRRSWRLRAGPAQRITLKLSKTFGDITRMMFIRMKAVKPYRVTSS